MTAAHGTRYKQDIDRRLEYEKSSLLLDFLNPELPNPET
jgi:hypothetical protein